MAASLVWIFCVCGAGLRSQETPTTACLGALVGMREKGGRESVRMLLKCAAIGWIDFGTSSSTEEEVHHHYTKK